MAIWGMKVGRGDRNGPGSHIGPPDSISGAGISITAREKEWAQCPSEDSWSWAVGMRGKEAGGRDLGMGGWRQGKFESRPPWMQGLASVCMPPPLQSRHPPPCQLSAGPQRFLTRQAVAHRCEPPPWGFLSQDKFLGLLRSLAPPLPSPIWQCFGPPLSSRFPIPQACPQDRVCGSEEEPVWMDAE